MVSIAILFYIAIRKKRAKIAFHRCSATPTSSASVDLTGHGTHSIRGNYSQEEELLEKLDQNEFAEEQVYPTSEQHKRSSGTIFLVTKHRRGLAICFR